jgi:NodT family efflux transporter outer membrane factor (OMF) lipoprotein
LMGSPPGALTAELSTPAPIPPVPPQVPVGVPSELAARRPDIRAADAQLHGATAEVGQAEADFYPKVTIDAGFGFQSLSFRDLGFWNARAWNVGPTITLPIFQGGRLRGQLMLKKAAQKEAAINYRKTVLSAWKDVDDSLIAYSTEQARHDRLAAETVTNQRAYVLAKEQYRHGMTSSLQVLDAERRVLQSELNLADSTSSVSTNLVRLYNALGGGWESVFPDGKPAATMASRGAETFSNPAKSQPSAVSTGGGAG